LYSSHIPARVFNKVVQPLPGFPITKIISPGWMAAEKFRKMGRDDGRCTLLVMGSSRPKPDFASVTILGAGRAFTPVSIPVTYP
jgi:hypothetical protein